MRVLLNRPVWTELSWHLGRFSRWWLRELMDLIPERFRAMISASELPRVIIHAGQEQVALELRSGSSLPTASRDLLPGSKVIEDINELLRHHKLAFKDVEIGLELPASHLFSRQIRIPAEVRGKIDTVVAQDLARRTPFKVDDIYSGYLASERLGGETINVQQWIVRRKFVREALDRLGLTTEDIHIVTFQGSVTTQAEPLIQMRATSSARRPFYQMIGLGLGCSAVLLMLIWVGLRFWNQQLVLDSLDQKIAEATSQARLVRTLADEVQVKNNVLSRLRQQKSEAPNLLDLWDETTRVLPAHSWLTDLRITEVPAKGEQQVTVMGFSSAAPSLVNSFDASRLFYDAGLISPVALDPVEGRERFVLQAKVRLPELPKGSSR